MCGEESCGVDSSRVLWRRKAEGGEGWESGQPRSCGGAGGSELGHGDTGDTAEPGRGGDWGGVPCPRGRAWPPRDCLGLQTKCLTPL